VTLRVHTDGLGALVDRRDRVRTLALLALSGAGDPVTEVTGLTGLLGVDEAVVDTATVGVVLHIRIPDARSILGAGSLGGVTTDVTVASAAGGVPVTAGLVILAGALIAVAGAGGSQAHASGTGVPVRGGTLHVT
jgi:hypothetical protein